jgi:hypothetical protein
MKHHTNSSNKPHSFSSIQKRDGSKRLLLIVKKKNDQRLEDIFHGSDRLDRLMQPNS